MRKAKEVAGRKCPFCGKTEHQVNAGKNRSGTQRCFCNDCKKYYTLDPKTREYPEEIRQQAIKTYYAGASSRGVERYLASTKLTFTTGLKKTAQIQKTDYHILELDELYWFVGKNLRRKPVKTPI